MIADLAVAGCLKVAFPSRVSADRRARHHERQRRSQACDSCRHGGVIEAYRCHADPSHWHVGHWPNERRRAEREAADRRVSMRGLGY